MTNIIIASILWGGLFLFFLGCGIYYFIKKHLKYKKYLQSPEKKIIDYIAKNIDYEKVKKDCTPNFGLVYLIFWIGKTKYKLFQDGDMYIDNVYMSGNKYVSGIVNDYLNAIKKQDEIIRKNNIVKIANEIT